jgi:hypothetical protein
VMRLKNSTVSSTVRRWRSCRFGGDSLMRADREGHDRAVANRHASVDHRWLEEPPVGRLCIMVSV